MNLLIEKRISENIKVKKELLSYTHVINEISRKVLGIYQNGGKVILFGNGGSAADAQHIAAELTGRFYLDRESLSAMALTTNTSSITALGNDYSFEDIFVKQLEGLGTEGDLAIGISTSGNSQNVIKALRLAKEKGLFTIGFTGKNGGKMKDIVDLCLRIPSDDTPRIQEGHILVGHIICEIVEKELFGNND